MHKSEIKVGGIYQGDPNWMRKVLLISDLGDMVIYRDYGTLIEKYSSWISIENFANWAKTKIN